MTQAKNCGRGYNQDMDFANLFSFWTALTESQKNALSRASRTETYRAGSLIHRADGNCKGVMAILSGMLRVYCVSEEGREVTLYRVSAGEVCILSASCLMDSIVFEVLIEAVGDTEVCLLPAQVLHRIEEENAAVGLYIYKTAAEKFSEVLWTIQRILFMKIDKRILLFLREEAAREHSNTVRITHEELAKNIGSVREVVTKTLRYLADEGTILLSRGKISLL